jgi:NADH-ubiquinone oxidoreductase chain 3
MTLFILFVSIIALLFLFINLIFAPHNPYQEKYSIFECGFHSFLGQNRTQFGIKFFIYALIYLLLDLEILLIFPFALSTYINNAYGLLIALIFIIIVTIGFIFELGKGALKIDSRQNSNNIEKINTLNISHISNISQSSTSISDKNIILESSIIPFKSITLKGVIKVIIISIMVYYLKPYIHNIFHHFINDLLTLHVLSSVISLIISLSCHDMYDYIIKDINLLEKINISNINYMEQGESSKMGESSKGGSTNTGESWKVGESSKSTGRVITDSDYESDSDSSTKKVHSDSYQSDREDNEEDVSKLVNSNLPEFEKTLKHLTNEELVETMNTIDIMRTEYYNSKVPSAKTQIDILNTKEDLVAKQISENFSTTDSESKGKEVDTNNDKDRKGKGKEINQ